MNFIIFPYIPNYNKASPIIDEIQLQSSELLGAVSPLQAKISKINNKKREIIDLVLDGTISKDDLKKQIQSYDQEIDVLNKQIEEAKNSSRIIQDQVNGIQEYITEINKIMNFDTEDGLLYRELVDKVVIFKDNYVVVYLNCVPSGVKLHYQATGRKNNYTVVVDNVETVY